MKISDTFPRLQKSNAILIVSGRFTATIYRLRDGLIHERETIEIKKPEYSDKEGHFENRAQGGKLMASGAGYEAKISYMDMRFLANLVKEVRNIKKPYTDVYLYAPAHVSNEVKNALPKAVANKIKESFLGNFTKHHYIDLLKKIKNTREERAKKIVV